jgi:hypothetical protein
MLALACSPPVAPSNASSSNATSSSKAASLAANDDAGAPITAPGDDVPFVTVTFVDAVLALSRDDGVAWDSTHVVPELVRAELRVALTRPDPYGRVLERIAVRDAEPWGKPDPAGHVTLMASATCRQETRLLPAQRDTYRPSWAPGLVWTHIPLERATRFRIVLEDDDAPAPSELVGAVDIAYAALDAALAKAGAVHRVEVSEQRQPILFVGIRVVRE